jgi:hypothetical protein
MAQILGQPCEFCLPRLGLPLLIGQLTMPTGPFAATMELHGRTTDWTENTGGVLFIHISKTVLITY